MAIIMFASIITTHILYDITLNLLLVYVVVISNLDISYCQLIYVLISIITFELIPNLSFLFNVMIIYIVIFIHFLI